MNFKLDLENILKQQLDAVGIHYKRNIDISTLVPRYLEMSVRRIEPVPRRVHFSDELHDSLGKLARESRAEKKDKALEAWRTVFQICQLLEEGQNVIRFLGERINRLMSRDGMLWDFGMHHFHLSEEIETSGRAKGFVKRSAYQLLAIIAREDAYFVDVRPHPKPNSLEWVRQDLLNIVLANWPELIESRELRAVKGTELTDEEKHEIRRKNGNHVIQLGDRVVMPLGGGTTAAGSSTLCQVFGIRLLRSVEDNQSYFDSQPADLRSQLEAKGIEIAGDMEFQLVSLESLNPSPELIDALKDDRCLGRDLCHMGFAIVEATTQKPIVVSIENLVEVS